MFSPLCSKTFHIFFTHNNLLRCRVLLLLLILQMWKRRYREVKYIPPRLHAISKARIRTGSRALVLKHSAIPEHRRPCSLLTTARDFSRHPLSPWHICHTLPCPDFSLVLGDPPLHGGLLWWLEVPRSSREKEPHRNFPSWESQPAPWSRGACFQAPAMGSPSAVPPALGATRHLSHPWRLLGEERRKPGPSIWPDVLRSRRNCPSLCAGGKVL